MFHELWISRAVLSAYGHQLTRREATPAREEELSSERSERGRVQQTEDLCFNMRLLSVLKRGRGGTGNRYLQNYTEIEIYREKKQLNYNNSLSLFPELPLYIV